MSQLALFLTVLAALGVLGYLAVAHPEGFAATFGGLVAVALAALFLLATWQLCGKAVTQ